MRVVINALAPEGVGGGITHLKNVIPRLANDGNDYIVCVPNARDILEEPEASNVRLWDIPYVDNLFVRFLFEQLILPVLLLNWQTDVLFSTADITTFLAPCPVLLEIQNPNPYVSSPGSDAGLNLKVKYFLQRYLAIASSRKADHVFFVSKYSMTTANQHLRLPKQKISYIYHGVDHTRFRDPSSNDDEVQRKVSREGRYVLCISTLYHHKNHETLIKGFARLSDSVRSDLKLLIVGREASAEYKGRLDHVADFCDVSESVEFLGEVPDDAIPTLYQNATVYVLPSKLETFGLTLIEAMASGTPVIGADSASIPEIVDDAALLFDPEDEADLAVQLERVLTDDSLRTSLVEAGESRANEFSWDKTVIETKQLLEHVHNP